MARLHAPLVAGAIATGAISVALFGGAAHAATAPSSPCATDSTTGSCLVPTTNVSAIETTRSSEPTTTAPTTTAPTTAAPSSEAAVLGETFTNGPTSNGSGGLPFTGADVIPLVVGGGALLIGGATFVLMGSRRRRPQHH